MAILGAVKTPVNRAPSIEDVIAWVEAQATKKDMGGAGARVRVTSLRQMVEQVAADESRDAHSVLANIDRLRERWARGNVGGKANTAKTYASRAKGTIEEYLRWAAAPDKYDPKKSKARSDEPKKSPPPKKADSNTSAAPPIEEPIPPPPPSTGEIRKCNLGAGRDPFRYILPADGLQVKDALRIAYHLITICDDYDPMQSPIHLVSTALQRKE